MARRGGRKERPEAGPDPVRAAAELRDAMRALAARPCPPSPRPVRVLCPLDYAWDNHRAYVERWARRGVSALLVGMNPGPWGMGQTGVPFGDPALVRDFLGIDGPVERPPGEHPRCPVLGTASPRAEVSGQRLWGGARACFREPGAFFAQFFVANYCPLLFVDDAGGANVTPDKIPAAWMAPVLDACDRHLVALVRALDAPRVVGVGAWATRRAAAALAAAGLDGRVAVAALLHPSPASPAANRGWLDAARRQLDALGCPWPAPD